jgi:hypothetical protein
MLRPFVLIALVAVTPARALAFYGMQELNPSDAYPGTGDDVAVSGTDVAVAFTGARGEVRIYRPSRDGRGFVLVQTLDGDDDAGLPDEDPRASFDAYGRAMAADENWLFVCDHFGDDFRGRAYVYRKVGGRWELYQLIDNPAMGTPPSFGWLTAVGGGTAVIGAFDQLHVYRFRVALDGEDIVYRWVRDTELELPRTEDTFTSVAVDGNRILVGSAVPSSRGVLPAAYIYERDATEWPLVDMLEADDTEIEGMSSEYGGDEYGQSVDLAGNVAIVGAPDAGDGDYGKVYVFTRDGLGQWDVWQEIDSPDISTHGNFGQQVSLSGSRLAVGDATRFPEGAVLVYEVDVWAFELVDELVALHPRSSLSGLGNAVDMVGTVIAAGFQSEGYNGNTYVFFQF